MAFSVISRPARLLAAALLFVAAASGTAAEAQAQQGETVQQKRLTQAEVTGLIGSWPELEALGRKYDQGWRGGLETLPLPGQASAMAELERTVKAHGFSDFEHWVAVAQSVALAYGVATSGVSVDQMRAEAEDAIRQMETAPGMTDAQRRQMAEMMRESMSALESVRPPDENVELVRGMADELKPIMEAD